MEITVPRMVVCVVIHRPFCRCENLVRGPDNKWHQMLSQIMRDEPLGAPLRAVTANRLPYFQWSRIVGIQAGSS